MTSSLMKLVKLVKLVKPLMTLMTPDKTRRVLDSRMFKYSQSVSQSDLRTSPGRFNDDKNDNNIVIMIISEQTKKLDCSN